MCFDSFTGRLDPKCVTDAGYRIGNIVTKRLHDVLGIPNIHGIAGNQDQTVFGLQKEDVHIYALIIFDREHAFFARHASVRHEPTF